MIDFTLSWLSPPTPANPEGGGIDPTGRIAITDNGRFLLFTAWEGLVPEDVDSASDVYLKDLTTGQLTLVSTTGDETLVADYNTSGGVSADGRYVVFTTSSQRLAPDHYGFLDVCRKDLLTGEIVRVSVSSVDPNGPNNGSGNARITADGRYVFFESTASNLTQWEPNFASDVFRRDMVTGQTMVVSNSSDGMQSSAGAHLDDISSDGRFVLFDSAGSFVPKDTNATLDVFIKDLQTGFTTRVSETADGTQGNDFSYDGSLAVGGRYVAFTSFATNLASGDTNGWSDVYVKDLQTGAIVRASTAADGSEGNQHSVNGRVSADGRYVVFASEASNLVAGDTNGMMDIFRKDLLTGEIVRVSVGADGAQGDHLSWAPFSNDGQNILFMSAASNFAPDANATTDIFLATAYSNHAPLAADDSFSVAEDAGPITLNVLANDTDPDAGDTLKVVSVNTSGAFGTVGFNAATGAITYTADHPDFDLLGFVGNPTSFTDSLTYTVEDASGAQSTATITIRISAVADGRIISGSSRSEVIDTSWNNNKGPGAGEDVVTAGSGSDSVSGDDGADKLDGGSGSDSLDGGAGHDWMDGASGDDTLVGASGRDTLIGDSGEDRIYGGGGEDSLQGGSGGDKLAAGAGSDVITGGSGADILIFELGSAADRDLVTDFSAADAIELTGGLTLASRNSLADVTGDGKLDTVLILNSGQQIVLSGFTAWNDGFLTVV